MSQELTKIAGRAAAATKGPWKFDSDCWLEGAARDGEFVFCPGPYSRESVQTIEMRGPDAEFISHARQDIPLLLDIIARIQVLAESAVTVHGRLSLRDEILRALKEAA